MQYLQRLMGLTGTSVGNGVGTANAGTNTGYLDPQIMNYLKLLMSINSNDSNGAASSAPKKPDPSSPPLSPPPSLSTPSSYTDTPATGVPSGNNYFGADSDPMRGPLPEPMTPEQIRMQQDWYVQEAQRRQSMSQSQSQSQSPYQSLYQYRHKR